MHSLKQVLFTFRSRPKAHLAIAFVVVSNHMSVVGLAAAPAVLSMSEHPSQAACSPDGDCRPTAGAEDSTLSLPDGMRQCGDSGPAAACGTVTSTTDAAAGTSSLPDGQAPCATSTDKPVPTTPASCSDAVLSAGTPTGKLGASTDPSPIVAPSVPLDSLGNQTPVRLTLASSIATAASGKPAVLSATASASVTGTSVAIEIFDLTSGTLAGACAQGSQCNVAYTATSGTHQFAAYLTPPTSSLPGDSVAVRSNSVIVGWLDSSITASRTVVGPGQPVVVTATSTLDVSQTGRWLEIYDLTTGSRLTYCGRGTVCSTSLKEASGGAHELVAYVNGQPEAVSPPIYVTWLSVTLSATSIGPKTGGSVYLKATTNADLTNTPWAVGIFDEQGRLVDHACKTGNTCSVQAWMSGGTTPTYTAEIGAVPTNKPATSSQKGHTSGAAATPAPGFLEVQAKSGSVQPTRLLWGVDSCKAFTGDVSGELYPAVTSGLGTPDFWGRYLTDTVCPGISSAEVALAARNHMAILPIYNDYNCSNVSYYDTGHGYGVAASAAAARLGIPKGRLLVIDIEPYGAACPGAGNVDSGFIEGWYDGVSRAGYVPGYYGNGTAGSEFASAWCSAVSALPNIATGSDLWSFEPSLLGSLYKSVAPGYSPYDTSCAGNIEAWQYQLGSNGINQDVDQDEALSSLALWYPSA